MYVTDKRLSKINFAAYNMEKIIVRLNSNTKPMVMIASVSAC